ncbi:NAD(P)-binding protein [Cylindrobasidium torrendii FP15055 ss-10]|uniref:NAD(P)-binding protein n=1 Tax=Cylindrobasidium torrendii FP15055 ss-10 TaxID=1314674 RepID=A0A0D7B477_9AGAR|nr:NAD(P)-binding protein [Cylindrobasidium torrendii FP15055 ss-10]
MISHNPTVIFRKAVPDGALPVAGEHIVSDDTCTIDLENVRLGGGFLTETIAVTPESSMRLRMRPREKADFVTTFNLNEPLVGFGLVKVLRSEEDSIKEGDILMGLTPWQKYTVQPYVEADPAGAFPVEQYLVALGNPGMAAYFALHGLAKIKTASIISICTSMRLLTRPSLAIQLAKQAGSTVIASAGSESKLEYLRDLGADHVFNYQTDGYVHPLAKHGPVDIVIDCVGGEALEAAIEHASFKAQIIIVGASADYGVPASERYGVKNMEYVFQKALKISGLFMLDQLDLFEEYFSVIPEMLKSGKVTSRILRVDGLKNGPQAMVNMLTGNGGQVGKPIIFV